MSFDEAILLRRPSQRVEVSLSPPRSDSPVGLRAHKLSRRERGRQAGKDAVQVTPTESEPPKRKVRQAQPAAAPTSSPKVLQAPTTDADAAKPQAKQPDASPEGKRRGRPKKVVANATATAAVEPKVVTNDPIAKMPGTQTARDAPVSDKPASNVVLPNDDVPLIKDLMSIRQFQMDNLPFPPRVLREAMEKVIRDVGDETISRKELRLRTEKLLNQPLAEHKALMHTLCIEISAELEQRRAQQTSVCDVAESVSQPTMAEMQRQLKEHAERLRALEAALQTRDDALRQAAKLLIEKKP